MNTKLALNLLLGSLLSCAADPSLKPLSDVTGQSKYSERYRIIVDLDSDGVDDMLLSGSPIEFGAMGGPWTVHLNREGDFKPIGEIWAHPKAISFEPDQARLLSDAKEHRFARVWVYLKSSGSEGSFGYFRIGKSSVDEMASLEIYPGDGGTEVGRSLYEAAFKKSPIPFQIQRSTTTEDGVVTWKEFQS
ncbi:hypothetical protein AAFN60_05075 [Roseibacillus persicicus]|uniref:hypothetical protein n=1 Tax=Roseibacillus persicicus TaxID=454148 RepID=UPI00398B79F5